MAFPAGKCLAPDYEELNHLTEAPMIKVSKRKDQTRLRRIALAAQGLLQSQPFGRGLSDTHKAIQHIGYVQIDTISVVERAHHHVLRSRVPNY